MPSSNRFRPEEFAPEIALLEEVPGRWSVFGGMATIIWAERFLEPGERAFTGLGEPFTSKDLDLRGSRAHAMMVWGLWGARGEMCELTWKVGGRRLWALSSHPQGDPARRVVEVTEQVPGLSPQEGIALRVTHRDVRLHVLDPVSCLKAKNDVLRRELAANVAEDRNDARHVALLLAVLPRYLEEIAAKPSPSIHAAVEAARAEPVVAEAHSLLEAYHAQLPPPSVSSYLPAAEPLGSSEGLSQGAG